MEELKYVAEILNTLGTEAKETFTLWLLFHYLLPAIAIVTILLVLIVGIRRWLNSYYLTEEFHEDLSRALGQVPSGILRDYDQQEVLKAVKRGMKK